MSLRGQLIDGRAVAQTLRAELQKEIHELRGQGIVPALAVLWVGDDPASGIYFRAKEKLARELGIEFRGEKLDAGISLDSLLDELDELNCDSEIDGIFVEFPLPDHISPEAVRNAIAPEKDVDGITPVNLGKLLIEQEGLIPATPYGVMMLLRASGVELRGANAVMVGRSEVVGKPLALLLLNADATVTLCHSKTRNLREHTLRADVLCVAVGQPRMITADMVQDGAAVIDIGLNWTPGSIVGDVDFERVKERSSLITPVPGGVGPMTATVVMKNTVEATKRRVAIKHVRH
ncbi:MAG: bifunctional methylenetetrahydrofolate dehydrogenase/methenyltetrahydrofolate cyclohydrolase [Candidatus Fraserbacteria bacterium RBG_16_55_9]|uniref:Bifunctional protein FolD n=1 Tax=Fraserbacteria sp. (strain RBG_16_55_9) TaxID=1817864 RepID=A0A1F5URS7_FRAXR|nr:MAG: bifunctional methylenetetrahydrofolate dehydrogenase/methenyltetrahydrofolate cyclohydrolase [Candidatus Fraserbacteria bacterium RBG_16_55_9]